MPVRVVYKKCGAKGHAPNLPGKQVRCPKCGTMITISAPVEEPKVIVVEEDPEPVAEFDEPAEATAQRRKPPTGRRVPDRKAIDEMVPEEYLEQLRPGERAYDFAYVDYVGGCGSWQAGGKQWILITNQRILYEATVRQPGQKVTFLRNSGSIHTAKISFVRTVTVEKQEGCDRRKVNLLTINSGGGEIELVIPTAKEADRLRRSIDDLVSAP